MPRFASLVALALVASAATAHANGRPPEPVALHFGPATDNDIYLQVTFGMLESHDADHKIWRWVCEDAINYSGMYDPDYVISSMGALFATTFDGLQVRRDGCTFVATTLGTLFATAVGSDPTGATLYAAVADTTQNDHNVYISVDDGMTWNKSSTGLGGAEVSWTRIEVAPSNPQVVYLSGYTFPTASTRTVTMYRSINGGAAWAPIDTSKLATTNNSQIVIAPISPDDPDLLVIAVSFPTQAGLESNAIWRSDDGGATWTQVAEFDDNVDGVVIRKYAGASTDAHTKAEVVLGTRVSGMWDSTDGGQSFTEITKPPSDGTAIETRCMIEHGGVLWACGNELPPDSMALGTSATPTNWTTVLKFQDIAGTVQCAAGTTEQDVCNLTRWCGLRDQLGVIPNPTNCSSLGADGAPPPDAPAAHPPGKGCCDAGGGPVGPSLLALVALAPFVRPRRRACPYTRGNEPFTRSTPCSSLASIESPTARST